MISLHEEKFKSKDSKKIYINNLLVTSFNYVNKLEENLKDFLDNLKNKNVYILKFFFRKIF